MTKTPISLPKDPYLPEWWGSFAMLVHNWPEVDRINLASMSHAVLDGGNPAHRPKTNSIDAMIWDAITSLGYAKATRNGPEVHYSLTHSGARRGVFCLLAQRACMNETGGDPSEQIAFAHQFARLSERHRNGDPQVLAEIQRFFLKTSNLMPYQNGSARDQVFADYADVGAVFQDEDQNWRPTQDAVMNAPFILDLFLTEKEVERRGAVAGE